MAYDNMGIFPITPNQRSTSPVFTQWTGAISNHGFLLVSIYRSFDVTKVAVDTLAC